MPEVVAHRGYARHYPENTLLALEAAIKAGAKYIEVDVQLSADKIPMLFHDRDLKRMCGQKGAMHEYSMAELSQFKASEFHRFGYKFVDTPLATLFALMGLLQRYPEVTAFVEIKRISIEQFGIDVVLSRIMPLLQPIAERCVLISFSIEALHKVRERGWPAVGAVIEDWKERKQALVQKLNPRYLFCDIDYLPKRGRLKFYASHIVVYECPDAETALALAERGVEFVETFACKEVQEGIWLNDANAS